MNLQNIHIAFGEKIVFDQLNLTIPTQGITCLMGSSGRGKTTLLRLVAGLLVPQKGKVEHAPTCPAVMFQEDRLLPTFSALANIQAVLPPNGKNPKKAQKIAAHWLDAVGLGAEKHALPAKLSGGMQRRVSLARTLAFGQEMGADFLLLDEPFAGLDPDTTAQMAHLILEANIPALVITHAETEAQLLGNRIIRLPD